MTCFNELLLLQPTRKKNIKMIATKQKWINLTRNDMMYESKKTFPNSAIFKKKFQKSNFMTKL
ncbi:hypothetical protein DERP_013629 [Dermatophagoides pteronyssinus]|uniref:Uncharacterized protein n=1 Tax=Dermatophagoides pteronyssinus TaxID=6956 RepID=A0ABQ8IPS6_DERPT|nr:hypothetical protein DERP_013629 [Dermatophagoides pteronyssinus]